MLAQYTRGVAKHICAFLATGFILFIMLAPPVLFAFQFNQTQANQLQAESSIIDLNDMMLSSWKEWDALLTRWFSLNGTLVDAYDYARRDRGDPSNTTLSGIGFYILALTHMYNETRNNYYLSKLRVIVEGLLNNPFSRTYVPGVGYIFYVPAYYFDGLERDNSPVLTMTTAYASVKLWGWTHEVKFKELAERVAAESLLLAAINNSTDLAWSQGYYSGRDEQNAKLGVWRQAPITLFYTLYGKEIDPVYLTYVNRTLNWQFRAQLPGTGGLAYSIGETTPSKPYAGVHMFLLTQGYRISPAPYSVYREKMTNAMLWLQSLPIDFAYMENYAVTGALINSWKANLTADIDKINKIKTATYLGLKTLNFTTYGVFPKIPGVAFGWRWPQHYIASFLSTYPLPEGEFQTSQASHLIDYQSYPPWDPLSSEKDIVYGWMTNLGFDRFRINSMWGSGVYQFTGTLNTLYFFFGVDEEAASLVQSNSYYLNVKSTYAGSVVDQQIYVNGLSTAQVSGTATFSIQQEFQDQLDIFLPNSTTPFVLNELVNRTDVKLDTTLIIREHANPNHFFFIMSPNPTWTAHNQTGLLQLKTTITNGKLLLARLQMPSLSVSEAFDLFNHYAPYINQIPIAFTDMVDSYIQSKNHVGEQEYGIPSWEAVYENATRQEVKLVALNLPEIVEASNWNSINANLTAVFQGVPGVNSALKIYSGYRFSPIGVFINDTEQLWGTVWSFDRVTRTFTINITFSSPSLKLDVLFTEDVTPPRILSVERSIQNPEYNDTVTVWANITDDESGVGTVLLSYWNGTYWLSTTMSFNLNNSLFEGRIPPLRYATEVQYKVQAADRAENWDVRAEPYYSYTVIDTYPPVVAILVEHLLPNGTRVLRPAEGDYVSNNANITAYCQEANLEKMELYINDTFVKLWDQNGTQSYNWDTTSLVDGSSHSLKLTANDLAGNSAERTAVVSPDHTPPLIGSANWAPRNPTPEEDVDVAASIIDATSAVYSANILYRTGQGMVYMTQMTPKNGVWSGIIPRQPDDTTVMFTIEAFDIAGNRAQTQSSYRYDVGYSALPILILAIVAGISIGTMSLVAFVYYRKRRKLKTGKMPSEQSDIKDQASA